MVKESSSNIQITPLNMSLEYSIDISIIYTSCADNSPRNVPIYFILIQNTF